MLGDHTVMFKQESTMLGDHTVMFKHVAHHNKVVIYLWNNYSYLKK